MLPSYSLLLTVSETVECEWLARVAVRSPLAPAEMTSGSGRLSDDLTDGLSSAIPLVASAGRPPVNHTRQRRPAARLMPYSAGRLSAGSISSPALIFGASSSRFMIRTCVFFSRRRWGRLTLLRMRRPHATQKRGYINNGCLGKI